MCGLEVLRSSLKYHAETHHSRGWRSTMPPQKQGNNRKPVDPAINDKNCFRDLMRVPLKYRLPTGYYNNPSLVIPATLYCKWQQLYPWEYSPFEEVAPDHWKEDEHEKPSLIVRFYDTVTWLDVKEEQPVEVRHYSQAFASITDSHPWHWMRDWQQHVQCLICGQFVKERRQHLQKYHSSIRTPASMQCPHPWCSDEDVAAEDWLDHLMAAVDAHVGVTTATRVGLRTYPDPRSFALSHIPASRRVEWGYYPTPIICPTDEEVAKFVVGYDPVADEQKGEIAVTITDATDADDQPRKRTRFESSTSSDSSLSESVNSNDASALEAMLWNNS